MNLDSAKLNFKQKYYLDIFSHKLETNYLPKCYWDNMQHKSSLVCLRSNLDMLGIKLRRALLNCL
jgi:hypothetical protein